MRGLGLACAGALLATTAAAAPSPDLAPWMRSPSGWEVDLAPRDEPGAAS